MQNPLNDIDAMILCGGLVTRLRAVVSDRPKPMAEVNKKPFLEIVVDELLRQGIRRIIFCTGHLGEQIEAYFGGSPRAGDIAFSFSREEKPLGTGGAVKRALNLAQSERFFVMNGDTFAHIDFGEFYAGHAEKPSPVSIALVEKHCANGQGNVILGEGDIISSFTEDKGENESRFASAGCYLMGRDIEKHFPSHETFSLEYDVFPLLAGKSHGFVIGGNFLDIGTPERYAKAEGFFEE